MVYDMNLGIAMGHVYVELHQDSCFSTWRALMDKDAPSDVLLCCGVDFQGIEHLSFSAKYHHSLSIQPPARLIIDKTVGVSRIASPES